MCMTWLLAGLTLLVHPSISDRAEFARAMALVVSGMKPIQVRQLLGPPEKVVGLESPGFLRIHGCDEAWLYGLDESGAPTLGNIPFRDGEVRFDVQDIESSPLPEMGEKDLRAFLSLLFWAERTDGPNTVRVYNALHKLGRSKAIAVLDEYCRVNHADAFPTPVAEAGMLLFGETEDAPKEGEVRFHRNYLTSVAVVDGMPISAAMGGFSGGLRSLREWLHSLESAGTFRSSALRPPDDPTLVAAWLDGRKAMDIDTEKNRQIPVALPSTRIKALLLSTANTVASTHFEVKSTGEPDFSGSWEKLKTLTSSRSIRWDEDRDEYVFRDGSTLPPPPAPVVVLWEPTPAKALGLTVRVERSHGWTQLQALFPDKAKVKGAELRAEWWTGNRLQRLIKLEHMENTEYSFCGRYSAAVWPLLQPGDRLIVHLLIAGKEMASTETIL